MPLTERQVQALRYLGKHGAATAGNVARELKVSRPTALAALRGLADSRFAWVDRSTWPASWSVTDIGRTILAAAHFEQEP